MSDKKNSGPEEAIKGAVEGVKGKVKEVAGAVAGRDDLYREGQGGRGRKCPRRSQDRREAPGVRAAVASSQHEKAHQQHVAPSRVVLQNGASPSEAADRADRDRC